MGKFGFHWQTFYTTPIPAFIEVVFVTLGVIILFILLFLSIKYLYYYPSKYSTIFKKHSSSRALTLSNFPSHTKSITNSKTHDESPIRLKSSSPSPTTPSSPTTSVDSDDEMQSRSPSQSPLQSQLNQEELTFLQRYKMEIEIILGIGNIYKWLLLSSIIFGLFTITHYGTCLFLILFFNINVICGIRQIGMMYYAFQRISMYLFYIMRLYSSFKDSIYKINKIILILSCLFIIIGTYVIVIPFVTLSFLYTVKNTNNFECNWDTYLMPLIGAAYFIDITTNFSLVCIFVYKLKQVSKRSSSNSSSSSTVSMNDNNNKSNNDDNISVRRKARDGLQAVTQKLLVLLAFNMIISLFGLVILFYFVGSYAACAVDVVTSNTCLWLTFSFNQKFYNKLCLKIQNKCSK